MRVLINIEFPQQVLLVVYLKRFVLNLRLQSCLAQIVSFWFCHTRKIFENASQWEGEMGMPPECTYLWTRRDYHRLGSASFSLLCQCPIISKQVKWAARHFLVQKEKFSQKWIETPFLAIFDSKKVIYPKIGQNP